MQNPGNTLTCAGASKQVENEGFKMSNEIIQATPRDYYVYLHRRATTGACFYVGKGHGRRAWAKDGRGSYWSRIVKKHGYIVEIVQDGLQEFAAFELECDLIALHGRQDCGLGPLVNATDGGEGKSGAIASSETITKLSAVATDRWKNPEIRKKMAESIKGSLSTPEVRAIRSERAKSAWNNPERKNRMKEAYKDKWKNPEYRNKMLAIMSARLACPDVIAKFTESARKHNQARKKPVICVETGMVFQSGADAEKFLRENGKPDARGSDIYACCRGAQKSSNGYRWVFASAGSDAASLMLETEPTYKPNHGKGKPVVCMETGHVFQSGAEAIEFVRVKGYPKATNSHISSCCLGKLKSAYGFTWAFAS